MNISYNWLKQYLDFALTPEQTADALTAIGLETGGIEEVESIRGGLRGIVIGHVLTCTEHPDSDHLHVTTVDLGDGQPTQIVCGAPNVAAGQTVVVATVGTTLYDGDKEFKIKKSKIRGVESFGMICAEDEIGVGTSHDGIIVITDREVTPGTPAAEYFGLTSDYVLEVDLTPNRIDAASHYGVARDLAAWLKQNGYKYTLRRPACEWSGAAPSRPAAAGVQVNTPADAGREGAAPLQPIRVRVDNPEACTRYAGVTIRGIRVAESPDWLKSRLTAIGMRPINNVVDITNYILHAFCQPLHCFDVSKIKGGEIVVRTCAEGTKFVTLDGVERTLDARDLMICDAEEPMCIAGVFGGLDSGTTETTTDVFIESACFNPTSVRKTARRHALQTDSSFRFERGVDPNGTVYALKQAVKLIQELAGGEVCGDIVDIYPEPVEPYRVPFTYGDFTALVGKEVPAETIDSILDSLEMKWEKPGVLRVPTYRVDVRRTCDVIEDILRIYGYNNVEIGTTVHSSLQYKGLTDTASDLRELISNQLTACGFSEIMNNSLTAESYYTDCATWPLDTCVRLMNPLSSDLSVMRRTLLFGGMEVVAHNINRRCPDLILYEFGEVYRFDPAVAGREGAAPLQPFSEDSHLGIWMTGNAMAPSWNRQALETSFFDLRAVVANIFARLGITDRELKYTVEPADDIYAASMTVATRSGKALGRMGIVSAAVGKRFDVKQPVVYAELSWTELVKMAAPRKVTFAPLPKSQSVSRDLALLLDKGVTMAQVEQTVRASEKKLLRTVSLFDVYEGKNLPAGKKSYAINITLQDDERTLTDKQIDAVMAKIIANLTKQLGAELR